MTKQKDLGYRHGQTSVSTKANGFKVSTTVTGSSYGLMVEDTSESFAMIKNMGMVYTFGHAANNTLGNGKKVNSTDKEY